MKLHGHSYGFPSYLELLHFHHIIWEKRIIQLLKGSAMLVENVSEMQDLVKPCILMQIWLNSDEK